MSTIWSTYIAYAEKLGLNTSGSLFKEPMVSSSLSAPTTTLVKIGDFIALTSSARRTLMIGYGALHFGDSNVTRNTGCFGT